MLNQVQIIGRLGQDPEIHATQGGKKIAKLSVATTERWKDHNGVNQEATEWHRVTLFGNYAEVADRYLKKGILVFIQGKLKTNSYTDKNGNKAFSTEIVGKEMKMLSRGDNDNNAESQGNQGSQQQAPGQNFDPEDLPF